MQQAVDKSVEIAICCACRIPSPSGPVDLTIPNRFASPQLKFLLDERQPAKDLDASGRSVLRSAITTPAPFMFVIIHQLLPECCLEGMDGPASYRRSVRSIVDISLRLLTQFWGPLRTHQALRSVFQWRKCFRYWWETYDAFRTVSSSVPNFGLDYLDWLNRLDWIGLFKVAAWRWID